MPHEAQAHCERHAKGANPDRTSAVLADELRKSEDARVVLVVELAWARASLRASELKLADTVRQITEHNARLNLAELKTISAQARQKLQEAIAYVASQRGVKCDMLHFDADGKLTIPE